MGFEGHLEANGGSFEKGCVNAYLTAAKHVFRSFFTYIAFTTHVFPGKVKSIGVSNFSEVKLEEILSTAEIVPAVDQVSDSPANMNERSLIFPIV